MINCGVNIENNRYVSSFIGKVSRHDDYKIFMNAVINIYKMRRSRRKYNGTLITHRTMLCMGVYNGVVVTEYIVTIDNFEDEKTVLHVVSYNGDDIEFHITTSVYSVKREVESVYGKIYWG